MPRQIIEKEETLIIETPERVELEFALASIGNRFLAVAIDHSIQYLSIFLLAWFFLSIAGTGPAESADKLLSEMPKWTIAILIIVLFLSGGMAKRRRRGILTSMILSSIPILVGMSRACPGGTAWWTSKGPLKRWAQDWSCC